MYFILVEAKKIYLVKKEKETVISFVYETVAVLLISELTFQTN